MKTRPGSAVVERLIGAILVLVGGLMALLCGTCTLAFIKPANGLTVFALVIGGTPTAVGVGMLIAGVRLILNVQPKRMNKDLGN